MVYQRFKEKNDYNKEDRDFEKMIDNRLWLNPGSCGPRRFDQEITMAVMTVDYGTYQWEKVTMIPKK